MLSTVADFMEGEDEDYDGDGRGLDNDGDLDYDFDDAQCIAVPVEESTWGTVKALYR